MSLHALGHVAFPPEPRFPLLFNRMYCIKAVWVGRCSKNAKDHTYNFHLSCIKMGPASSPKGQFGGKTLSPPCLVQPPSPLSHTGLSLGPRMLPSSAPQREKGRWLILESRDLRCFCTTDSNQDTVCQSPPSLAELIPVPLPGSLKEIERKRAIESETRERERERENELVFENVISPVSKG